MKTLEKTEPAKGNHEFVLVMIIMMMMMVVNIRPTAKKSKNQKTTKT